jgi:hypothetical protein
VNFVLDTNAVSETRKPRPNSGLLDWLRQQWFNSLNPAFTHPPSSDFGTTSGRRRTIRRPLENSRDWIGWTVIRETRNVQLLFLLPAVN